MIANKKNILALLFLCLCSIVSGTNYYVSSTGNDAANGLSESTPWKSITKVNSAFSSFKPGDMVLFRRGDTFTGTLKPNASGTSGLPITIGAYGTGSNPIISGFTTISGWTNYGNGIYSKVVSCEVAPNVVSFNGTNKPIGRWPKTGYYATDAVSGTSELTASELNSSVANWTGAEVVVKSIDWVLDRCKINWHSGQTLGFDPCSYNLQTGWGYFIQNDIKTLTTVGGIAPILGEWYYNTGNSTFYMYFGAANPDNYTVKVSARNQLFFSNGKHYITLDNLSFEGASYTIFNSNSNYLTIQNCSIDFTGHNAIDMGNGSPDVYGTSTNFTLNNCIINHTNNNAINTGLWNGHTYVTITNNKIYNTGMIAGMGKNSNESYQALRIWDHHQLIQYNEIVNTGYLPIAFSGSYTKVLNNFINNFAVIKGDCGGIYTVVQSHSYIPVEQEIKYNIVLNGVGNDEGMGTHGFKGAHGIYLDDVARNVTIEGNTVAYCASTGIFLHNAHEITINNNTLFHNGTGHIPDGSQLFLKHDDLWPDDNIRNVSITNNKLISAESRYSENYGQWCITVSANHNDITSFFTVMDNNYYCKPLDNEGKIAKSWDYGQGTAARFSTFAEWKSFTGKDANSSKSPIALNDGNKLRFEYNGTKTNKIISLDAGYIDVTGTKYSGTITLLPYTSIVLMVDPNPSAAPSIPAYVSSAIENTTPAILEMTYNMTLANVATAASAFSVRVNSAARVVNTVAISGTKVRLTLASPILYGDVVTVAYSKPSSNPLQTVAGGQATNLSAQTVTNRVSSIPVVPSNPVYVGSTVENETPAKIELVYNMALSNVLPAVSAFTVNINLVSRPVSALAISGSSVILTLGSPVIFGDVITVSYTKPGTNALQSSTGLQVATMSAQTVGNKVNSVGPIYVSASVEKVTPNILEITYNENLDNNTIPTTSAFVVMVNGIQRTVTSVAISGKKVLLTLAIPVVHGDIITVSYIKPTINQLKKTTGEPAVSFSLPQRVTNNIIKKSNIYVFPNPAKEYINITIKEPSKDKQIIRIFDFSGKLCLETILDPLANTIRIPISLNSGVYIVQVIMGSLTSFTQKIIITN